MDQILSVLDNAMLQGLNYGIAVIGVAIAFRVLKYPDMTADGAFLIGASTFGAAVSAGYGWMPSMLLAIIAGGLCGFITACLFVKFGVNRLLTGILTSMMCYSMAFWVLAGHSNINLTDKATMFSAAQALDINAERSHLNLHPATLFVSALLAILIVIILYVVLRSEFGVVLRATGENEALVEGLGRRPQRYYTIGLVIANALVGFAGCLVSARQGFVDVNMGFGVIITLVAALVIGEELIRLIGLDPARYLAGRAVSGVVGACLYFFIYLIILRSSILGWIPIRIQPTDLKLMSALIVVFFVVIRTRARKSTEGTQEVLPI